ncbi:VOC family protein [Streptomyces sp. NBC_01362]|uniref:VOC family protein n=1 Tax=Streptomyces sp. NBC_01362 TaxID=2903839 RepID=UPI002E34BB89|nr:VOC family protein [Streptomyces sp. NBC_01362]
MRPADPSDGGDPKSVCGPAVVWPAAEKFLRARGAGEMPHPGGTLLDHLIRVARLLGEWGADPDLQAAGLCHAAYGTDGFGQALAGTTERVLLAELIGERAEALVHLYASCDRGVVYPRLANGRPVVFRDRFTGREHTPPEPDVRAFLEITAANELDVLAHNADLADRYGAALHRLFTRSRDLLSAAARDACAQRLSRHAPDAGPGIRITGLDHLVLTVADIDRSIGFYERVLGMRPVVFGDGRRALAFGTSKINLHQVDRELLPHATHPTPGSADLCLITDTPHRQILAHLAAGGVPVEEGPVPRTGAQGPITSTYLRDPDGNLIEISTYDRQAPTAT